MDKKLKSNQLPPRYIIQIVSLSLKFECGNGEWAKLTGLHLWLLADSWSYQYLSVRVTGTGRGRSRSRS